MTDYDEQKARAFLRDLSDLCQRHGVTDIVSCSCCDGTQVEGDGFRFTDFAVWDGKVGGVMNENYECEPHIVVTTEDQ